MKQIIFKRKCTELETNHLVRLTCWSKDSTYELVRGDVKKADRAISCVIHEDDVDRIVKWAKEVDLLNNNYTK